MDENIIEVAIEPLSRADRDRLSAAIARITAEDPSITFSTDVESGQTILKVASEERFAEVEARLRDEFGVSFATGQPQVAYRETLGVATEVNYTHKKQTGGAGQFARVKIQFEPLPPGGGQIFESKIVGGSVPREYIPGVEKGLKSVADTGIIAGFPVIDYKATLIYGAYHDVDSSVLAFEIASRAAFREAAKCSKAVLLEPIMRVEVVAPHADGSAVARDLRLRRARGINVERRGEEIVVVTEAPLTNLWGYRRTLDDITSSRGRVSMRFVRYEPVPKPPDDDDLFPPPWACAPKARP